MIFPINSDLYGVGKVRTVVIDPGHGGRDPGAVGKNSMEKDIALAIGLKLGEYIKENLPDVNVIYTRTEDKFVELHRRAEIANKNNADLFISIHCNSSPRPISYGTETFVMGLHRSQANLEVAKRENAAILYEEDYEETYDGFDPHSPEANIIFSLYQNAYLENSLEMASLIQQQFRERARRADRGVKQAGFLVLYQVTMPGVLVEAGFLSNPNEEKYLMSESGQAHIASAIFRAFREYKEQQEKLYASRKSNSYRYYKDKSEQEESEQINIAEKSSSNENFNNNPKTNNDICFRIQIATSSDKKPANSEEFKTINNKVDYYYHEGLYKYTVGNFSNPDEAIKTQKELQKAGFKDAFVVAFFNNERISPAKAIKLLNK